MCKKKYARPAQNHHDFACIQYILYSAIGDPAFAIGQLLIVWQMVDLVEFGWTTFF